MGARKEDRIPEPRVGMVIVENDPRGALPKRIHMTTPEYVVARAGHDGKGRRSRISYKRLAEGRYHLIAEYPPPKMEIPF